MGHVEGKNKSRIPHLCGIKDEEEEISCILFIFTKYVLKNVRRNLSTPRFPSEFTPLITCVPTSNYVKKYFDTYTHRYLQ